MKNFSNSFLFIVSILVLCAFCIVAYDCIQYISQGKFVILPELNMVQFSTEPPFDDLAAAAEYLFNDLPVIGYDRNDFCHIFISFAMILWVICMVTVLIIKLSKKDILHKHTKAACLLFSVLTLLLILSLRIFTDNTYARVEARDNYPIAYIFSTK